jgi:hypothetical protein
MALNERPPVCQLVLPVLESTRAQVSQQCPWRVDRDVYAAQEAKKQRVHEHHWQARVTGKGPKAQLVASALTRLRSVCCVHQCGVCAKAFYTEAAIDKHLHARHAALVPPQADVCLADFCDVLQCDVYDAAARGAIAARPMPAFAKSGSRKCASREMEMARHACESTLRLCLPQHSSAGGVGTTRNSTTREAARQRAAYERLMATHCGMLTCDHVHSMFAATAFAVRAWRYARRIGIVVLTVAVALYYIGVARDLLANSSWVNAAGTTPSRGQRSGRPGDPAGRRGVCILPKNELSRRVAVFLMGGKLGVRLAIAQLLWQVAQRTLRRMKQKSRKKEA